MSAFYSDYKKAFRVAESKANDTGLDIAIRAVREYGNQGFIVAFASRNDSDYARAEIVKPYPPTTGGETK